jgi:hypothetical protein
MEIVHLPDLDEQYVIKSKNKLAKSAFGLAFQDGAALAEVQGEHDATTLAVSILKEIQDAIGAAQEVAQAAVTRENNILKEQQKTAQGKDEKLFRAQAERAAKVGRHSIYQMVESISIKPGVYRLNKPWEIEGEGVLPTGQGLLAQMGLPMVRGVRFEPLASVEKP